MASYAIHFSRLVSWRGDVSGFGIPNLDAKPEMTGKLGYKKLVWVCTQALLIGLSYIWIDTCCIDKRSSAELSKASNSMDH